MRNIYILFDCPDESNDKKWLIDGLTKLHDGGRVQSVSINKTVSVLLRQGKTGRIRGHWVMLRQAMRAVKMSSEGDVILCWNAAEGLYANLVSLMRGNKRDIISMCWLSPAPCSRIERWLRKLALRNPKVKIVINSPDSPKEWKEYLGEGDLSRFYLLPDVYDSEIPFLEPVYKEEKYCFTGGITNRNWKLICDVALRKQNVKFVCVALEQDFKKQVEKIPDNMDVFFNIPYDKYFDLMKNAYLVLLPLADTKVSGLINLIKAAQYGLPCMITSTAATRQYYSEESQDLLAPNDVQEWSDKVDIWISMNREEYCSRTGKFSKYIYKEFSPQKAVEKIMSLL